MFSRYIRLQLSWTKHVASSVLVFNKWNFSVLKGCFWAEIILHTIILYDYVEFHFTSVPTEKAVIEVNLFFPNVPFDPPENVRKPKVFLCFHGDQKGTSGRKGLKKKQKLFFQHIQHHFQQQLFLRI